MSQQIRGQGGHLLFPIGPKNTNVVADIEILLRVKFSWIPFGGFRGKSNVSQPIRGQFGHLVFPMGRGAVAEEKSKMGKVNNGRRTPDHGQCMITIVHLSLRFRCTNIHLIALPVSATSQSARLYNNFMTLIPNVAFTELWQVTIEHLRRMWHANRECLPLRTPDKSFFGFAYAIAKDKFLKSVVILRTFHSNILNILWCFFLSMFLPIKRKEKGKECRLATKQQQNKRLDIC